MGLSQAGVAPRLGCLRTTMYLLPLVAVLTLQQAVGFSTTATTAAFVSSSHRVTSPHSFGVAVDSSTKCGVPSTTALAAAKDDEDQYDLTLLSPCKINLFLRILRKREDGFHELASLFQTIGFGDTLKFKLLGEDEESSEGDEVQDLFQCNMEGVPLDKSNLVLRAVDLMRNKTGNTKQRFKINLIKQVPAQAGLGGGSANAATAMFAVNELLGRPATQEQLVEWSGDLGSDITFFFSLGTAYCTGRGEIMTPTDPLPAGTKLTIVKPDIGLSTPAVFRALDYDKLSKVEPEELLKRFQDEGVINISDDAYINDLEFPAFKVVPELDKLKQDLQTIPGFSHVCMSGSGTSIFCIGEPSDREAFDAKFGPQQRSDLKVFHTEFISRENEQTWWA